MLEYQPAYFEKMFYPGFGPEGNIFLRLALHYEIIFIFYEHS